MADVPREVQDAVEKAAEGGQLPCEKAFALARELGVSPAVVGEALNLKKIKIIGCQLGCF